MLLNQRREGRCALGTGGTGHDITTQNRYHVNNTGKEGIVVRMAAARVASPPLSSLSSLAIHPAMATDAEG